MTKTTILLLILSLVIAGLLSFYQYFFKAKSNSKINWILSFLRFLSIFGLLLLLINPILSRKSTEIIKIPLAVVVDNSSSIENLEANEAAIAASEKINANAKLKDKFDIQNFQFSSAFISAETIDFKGSQSRLDLVGKGLKTNFKRINYFFLS